MRKPSYRKRITDQERGKIVEYYLIGMPRKKISKELEIGYSTVCETIREYEDLNKNLKK